MIVITHADHRRDTQHQQLLEYVWIALHVYL
jgi:hypothetical protein